MFLQIDAAQLEWRVAVFLSNDKVGIEEINDRDANPEDPEKDIHEKNRRVFNLPSRLIAKTYLFRTIFRGTGWAFAHDPDFFHVSKDPEFWDNLNTKFFTKYNGLDALHQKWARHVAQRKLIISPLGNHWEVPLKPDGQIPWSTMVNWPVQGTGADIVLIARLTLRNRLLKAGLPVLPVNTVHDSIVYDVPNDPDLIIKTAEIALGSFKDVSLNIKRIWDFTPAINFLGEVKLGPTLKEEQMLPYTKFLEDPKWTLKSLT